MITYEETRGDLHLLVRRLNAGIFYWEVSESEQIVESGLSEPRYSRNPEGEAIQQGKHMLDLLGGHERHGMS